MLNPLRMKIHPPMPFSMFNNSAPSKNRQQGVALVIVIWILSLLTLMAGSFAMSMRRESSVSMAIIGSAKAMAMAESGVMLAEFNLSQLDPELRWEANGSIYELERPNGVVRVRIFSESGKVDINASSETQISALLSAATNDGWQQQRLLNAILDWRDADDDTRILGAERKQYQQAGLSYGPSNNAFQNLEELQLVLGMNEAIYNQIEPWITVYSGMAEVNQRDASLELLAVLDQDLERRNIHDESLKKRLSADEASQDGEENDAEQTSISENQTYTITAEAKVRDEASAVLEVVVKYQDNQNGSPFQVLDWKQNLQYLQDPQGSEGNKGLSLFDGAMEHLVITIQDEFRYDDSD